MVLEQLLEQLGESKLEDHVWTLSVLKTLNEILPLEERLQPTDSGYKILHLLSILGDEDRQRILSSNVDTIQGILIITNDGTDVKHKYMSEKVHSGFINRIEDNSDTPMSREWPLIFGLMVASVSFVLIFVLVSMTQNLGLHDNKSWWQIIFKIFNSIITSFMNA